jgi:ferredoxin-thioredoxin reductase catalytic chain
MSGEARKKALHYFFEKVVGPLGYKFTPDEDLVDFLLEQEVALEGKHGIPFCPCQGLRTSVPATCRSSAPASLSTGSTSMP